MNQSGKRFGRWALLLASLLAAYFLFGGVCGILARPSIEIPGTAWTGMGHSARFEDEAKGFYDGEPFSYTAWAAGEPNNDGGTENYATLLKVDGSWAMYDVPGDVSGFYQDDKIGFVMETEEQVPVS